MTWRSIEHSQEYSRQYDTLKTKYPRLRDIMAGVEWALHNDAELFPSVPKHPQYKLVFTDPEDDFGAKPTPGFRILYVTTVPTFEP